jgi:hypothetical protein
MRLRQSELRTQQVSTRQKDNAWRGSGESPSQLACRGQIRPRSGGLLRSARFSCGEGTLLIRHSGVCHATFSPCGSCGGCDAEFSGMRFSACPRINEIGRRIIAQALLKMARRTNAPWPAVNHVDPGARLLLLGEERPATFEATLRVRAAAAPVPAAKAALARAPHRQHFGIELADCRERGRALFALLFRRAPFVPLPALPASLPWRILLA